MKKTKTKKKKQRKTTVWIFQATNLADCTIDSVHMAKKGKPQERN